MLWYSLEAPQRGASNEYPQHMFLSRNKKDIRIFRMKKAPYLLLWIIQSQQSLLYCFYYSTEKARDLTPIEIHPEIESKR